VGVDVMVRRFVVVMKRDYYNHLCLKLTKEAVSWNIGNLSNGYAS
jgi:hypothetical protein